MTDKNQWGCVLQESSYDKNEHLCEWIWNFITWIKRWMGRNLVDYTVKQAGFEIKVRVLNELSSVRIRVVSGIKWTDF